MSANQPRVDQRGLADPAASHEDEFDPVERLPLSGTDLEAQRRILDGSAGVDPFRATSLLGPAKEFGGNPEAFIAMKKQLFQLQ